MRSTSRNTSRRNLRSLKSASSYVRAELNSIGFGLLGHIDTGGLWLAVVALVLYVVMVVAGQSSLATNTTKN